MLFRGVSKLVLLVPFETGAERRKVSGTISAIYSNVQPVQYLCLCSTSSALSTSGGTEPTNAERVIIYFTFLLTS